MATTLIIVTVITVPLVPFYPGATRTVTKSLHRDGLIQLFVCTALALTILVIFLPARGNGPGG